MANMTPEFFAAIEDRVAEAYREGYRRGFTERADTYLRADDIEHHYQHAAAKQYLDDCRPPKAYEVRVDPASGIDSTVAALISSDGRGHLIHKTPSREGLNRIHCDADGLPTGGIVFPNPDYKVGE